jgi:hypothetical protein
MLKNILGKQFYYRCFNAVMIVVLALSMIVNTATISQAQSGTQPQAPLDVPYAIVSDGIVSDFSRVSTVIDWHSAGSCYNPPKAPTANSPAITADVAESITRVSLINASPNHKIYDKDLRATNNCNQYAFSKVVYDGAFAYWVDATGLVKLSKNANLGDAPTLISGSFADQKPYQIAVDGQFVYLSRDGYVNCGVFCFSNNPRLVKVDKNLGTVTGLDCSILSGCPYGVNLKVDPGSRYLYYMDTAGSLEQMDLSTPTTIIKLADHVTSYFPEGYLSLGCFKLICLYSDNIFIARGLTSGATHEIVKYNNSTAVPTSIYTSNYAYDVSINDLTVDANEIFFYEVRQNVPCNGCFISYTPWLFRSGKANQNSLANIYQISGFLGSLNRSFNLDTDGTKVYWIENGNILSLSNQATALPKYPMHISGMEVTQGVQTFPVSVPLIKGKRTFVRVYVQSDDAGHDIPGITARLKASLDGGASYTDWIDPTNVVAITVKRNPQRVNLNDGFLFELPWDWVNGLNLTLTAELNPNHNPEQTDAYVNNVLTIGPLLMNVSPRLELRIFEYFYNMGGSTFGPAFSERFGNTDWIRRAYPVDESVGAIQTSPGPGLKVSFTSIFDDNLANLVRYPTLPCEDKDTTASPDPKKADCQNLRASAYVASQEAGMRGDLEAAYGDTDNTSYYGLVGAGSETRNGATVSYFPRGQDGGKNGAGPAGPSWVGTYAAHEVGHSVGLGHPGTANTQCGIKGSDPIPSYPNGQVGANNDATNAQGFLDTPSYNYPRLDNSNLALGSQWFDIMAYCTPNWISDQNFKRIYQNLAGISPLLAPAVISGNTNWLSVYGGIFTASSTASIDYLEHVMGSPTIPAITPGGYAIRLLDAGRAKLADYAFTPSGETDSPLLLYGQIVPFVVNSRFVQIVHLSDQKVMAEDPISAHSPTVNGVALVNPASPISGTVKLTWAANHPDNLPLTFNVLTSRDGGAHFVPFVTHISGTSRDIDTRKLGGGATIFRVVASDGANTGYADSISYSLANKPPVVAISLPASDIHIHFGQVVNFSGEAIDAQDGTLADAKLTWSNGAATLGSGHLLSQNSILPPNPSSNLLPMGDNPITLTATNSLGLTGSAVVHVIVDDNVEPDGPTMQVSPGTVGWALNSGDTTKQTRTLTVSNFGTGSFTWNVTSDAAWLTVSAATGPDGGTLVATGDPAGMANGQIRTGHLIFTTTTNDVIQTIKLAVTLAVGDTLQSPYLGPLPASLSLYLPIVVR